MRDLNINRRSSGEGFNEEHDNASEFLNNNGECNDEPQHYSEMLYHSVSSDNLVNTKSTSKTYILHDIEDSDFQEALSMFSSESLSMSMENLSLRRRVLQEKTNSFILVNDSG